MAAKMEVILSAEDKASANIDHVKNKIDGIDSAGGGFKNLAANFASLHFAITDAAQLIGKAFESIERYANFAEVKEQLNLMAGQFGTTGDAIVASMKKVSEGQFSVEQATSAAAAALKNSLTPEQITGLTQAALAFNDVAGVSVPEAFEKLADAVQRGSAKTAIAIIGKDGLGDAMKGLAKSTDDAGKSGALYEAIMAKTATHMKTTAGATQSLGDNIDKLKASWSDLTLKISGIAVTALYGVIGVFYGAAAAATRMAAGIMAGVVAIKTLSLNFEGAKESAQVTKDLWGSAGELSAKADDYMKLAAAVQRTDAAAKTYAKTQEKIESGSTVDSGIIDGKNLGKESAAQEKKVLLVVNSTEATSKIAALNTSAEMLAKTITGPIIFGLSTEVALSTLAAMFSATGDVVKEIEKRHAFRFDEEPALQNIKRISDAVDMLYRKLTDTNYMLMVAQPVSKADVALGLVGGTQADARTTQFEQPSWYNPATGTEASKRKPAPVYADARTTQNVTINVQVTGPTAKDIDAELADLWSRKSSKLRRAAAA